jgi:beta-phosphoglucomutase
MKIAIGSSSKNAVPILRAIGLANAFDAVADGNHISRSKPDPEVFRLAAQRVGVSPEHCLVVEDADAGVEAARAAGMSVLAVGAANGHPKATLSVENLARIALDEFLLANVSPVEEPRASITI